MDADIAASVVDDSFEAFGTKGCRYMPPGGAAEVVDIVLIRHRRSSDRTRPRLTLGRGGFETTDRPEAIIVRDRDCQPLTGGVFTLPLASGSMLKFRIGEDPVADDVCGIAWRCSVTAL